MPTNSEIFRISFKKNRRYNENTANNQKGTEDILRKYKEEKPLEEFNSK